MCKNWRVCLQQGARLLLDVLGGGAEHRADGLVKDGLEALLRQRRALEVLVRVDFLGHLQALDGEK